MDAVIQFLSEYGSEMAYKTWEHLYISLLAALLGIIIAVPLGVALTRFQKQQER